MKIVWSEIRRGHKSELTDLEQELKQKKQQREQQQKIAERTQQSIGYNSAAALQLEINEYYQEYEKKVLEAIEYRQFELTKLRDEMEQLNCSTRALDLFWKSLEEQQNEHSRKFEQLVQ